MTNGRMTGQLLLSEEERSVLEQACRECGVSPSLVEGLIVAEARVFGMGRRHNLWREIDALLREQVEGDEGQVESSAGAGSE
jgi:hypothetical protein